MEPVDSIKQMIYNVRGVKVMLDATDKILRSNFLTSKNNLYNFKSSFLRN